MMNFQIQAFRQKNKLLTSSIILLLIIVVLELTLFNYKYWVSLTYEPYDIAPYAWNEDMYKISDNTWYFNEDYSQLYFKDIDKEIKNIRLEFEDHTDFASEGTWRNYTSTNYQLLQQVRFSLMMNDYSNSDGLQMPERVVVKSIESTQYIDVHLNGTTSRMSIQFIDVSGRIIELKHATINAKIPMFFRIDRIALIFCISLLMYIVWPTSKYYKTRLDFSSVHQKTIISVVILSLIVFAFYLVKSNTLLMKNMIWFSDDYNKKYNMLTESLLNGHLYIDKDVTPEILKLDNPYDPSALEKIGESWNDFAFFNGKYYLYFGIVPVLLFYLPARVLFGINLTAYQCMVFLIPAFISGSFCLIYQLLKRYTKARNCISLLSYLLVSVLFIGGSFGIFGLASPDMYYLPIFTAMTLCVWGLFFWIYSLKDYCEPENCNDNIFSCNELNPVALALGSLCMSLIAGSRPQLLSLIFLSIPIFFDAVFKKRILLSKKSVINNVCFMAPIISFALFICWYNYVRFGNIFDFGATYNLTSNDMTARCFSLGRIFQGIYYYLIQPTNWEEAFPYIRNAVHNTQYTGTNIFEETFGGILFIQPSLFLLFLIPQIKKQLKQHGVYEILLILITSGVVIACFNSVMAAVLARYYLDLGIPFMLAVCFVALELISSEKDTVLKDICNKALPFFAVTSIAVSVLLVFNVIQDGAGWWYSNPQRFYQLKTLIEFWY